MTNHQNAVQQSHRRYAETPAAFVDSTLAAAIKSTRTEGAERARLKAQRQALRLIRRRELETMAEHRLGDLCTCHRLCSSDRARGEACDRCRAREELADRAERLLEGWGNVT